MKTNKWLATAYDGTERMFTDRASAEAYDYYGEPMYLGEDEGEAMCFVITDEE